MILNWITQVPKSNQQIFVFVSQILLKIEQIYCVIEATKFY